MHSAAGQAPKQEAVDRPERQATAICQRARAVDVVENPGDFRGGEIRIELEARAGRDYILDAIFLQGATLLRRTAVQTIAR